MTVLAAAVANRVGCGSSGGFSPRGPAPRVSGHVSNSASCVSSHSSSASLSPAPPPPDAAAPPQHAFLATGDPEPFARLGRRFLGTEVGSVLRAGAVGAA